MRPASNRMRNLHPIPIPKILNPHAFSKIHTIAFPRSDFSFLLSTTPPIPQPWRDRCFCTGSPSIGKMGGLRYNAPHDNATGSETLAFHFNARAGDYCSFSHSRGRYRVWRLVGPPEPVKNLFLIKWQFFGFTVFRDTLGTFNTRWENQNHGEHSLYSSIPQLSYRL